MKVTSDTTKREEAVAEITSWLQKCWQYMEDGRVAAMQPDPFYPRNKVLTAKIVEEVTHTLEFDIFQFEIEKYPDYHRKHQGISSGEYLIRPGFTELPYHAKLFLVQGADRVLQKYRS